MESSATMPILRAVETFTAPYPPSWVDRLVAWIGRLPIPAWVFYPVLLLAEYVALNAIYWLNGYKVVGVLDLERSYLVIYNVINLAGIQFFNQVAGRSFEAFRSALGLTASEEARLKYELIVMPARSVWVACALGIIFTLVSSWSLQSYFAVVPWLSRGAELFVFAADIVLSAVLFYHTVRQLRTVSVIHQRATRIDLFQPDPLYAFSTLTALTGGAFIVVVYFNLAVNSVALNSPPLLALNGVNLLIAAACFVLPLYGMHQRIVAEKARLLTEANQRLETVRQALYARVDALDLHDADGVNKSIMSLVSLRDLIAKLSTWPWHPNVATGFVTALLLPIVVWLITRVLSRFGL